MFKIGDKVRFKEGKSEYGLEKDNNAYHKLYYPNDDIFVIRRIDKRIVYFNGHDVGCYFDRLELAEEKPFTINDLKTGDVVRIKDGTCEKAVEKDNDFIKSLVYLILKYETMLGYRTPDTSETEQQAIRKLTLERDLLRQKCQELELALNEPATKTYPALINVGGYHHIRELTATQMGTTEGYLDHQVQIKAEPKNV